MAAVRRDGKMIEAQSEMKFSDAELEFLAEDEQVEIVPRFKFREVQLLTGPCGKFEPMVPVKVPLWFALQLQEQKMCTIQLPSYLSPEELDEQVEQEERDRELNHLSPMHFHYHELAALMQRHSRTFQESDSWIKVKDVEEVRDRKLHTSLGELQGYTPVVKISNATAMEINTVRPFLVASLHKFRTLHVAEAAVAGVSQNAVDSQAAGGL
mmetsp:Transcript_57151/g.135723  ORF Transcript_57151/g.135723 Transcript_57151/m.135723 type:complete len:211 (+) Transcript_57151:82-714(+)